MEDDVTIWPEGIPRTNAELFREGGEWQKFILNKLRSFNKVGRNLRDLYQDICLRLIAANVLEKFVKKACTRLPAEMTAEEMCAYLGIPYKTLEYMHWRYDNPTKARQDQVPVWMPTPIRGGRYSKKGIYARADVIDLDHLMDKPGSGCKRKNGMARRMTFAPTGDGFKTYLGQAVHNHFANYCRTVSRKEKENLLPGSAVVSSHTDGSYHVSTSFEDNSSWEANLVDPVMHEDALEARMDFVKHFCEACEEAGLDASVIGDYMLGQTVTATEDAITGIEILEYMAKARVPLHEAFQKVRGVTLSTSLVRKIQGKVLGFPKRMAS